MFPNPALASILMEGNNLWWIVGGIAVLGILIFLVFILNVVSIWIQAWLTRADVGLLDLATMRFRKVNPSTIVTNKIALVKAGMSEIKTAQLESHYLAGGRVLNVCRAMIAAKSAKIELDWGTCAAIDLAGRDIIDAVHTSVNPKVIDCPNPESGKRTIDAVAMDGIQLRARARVTVRTNISQLVGGATEETIIARVGEGIVSAIGSSPTHADVLANPDKISKAVLARALDAGTAYEILSIDIADIDVGENIGSRLQADQAEADSKRFKAEAEKRRAMAVALEQENKAKIQENQALVVLAEAEVPKAIADSFRSGNLGIMDHYRMRNIESDTGMRNSIGGEGTGGKST
ncbi:MAG: flotillin-like protein FloA [Planctomycetes bacterium]|nr:flotillin-like protein FloA [Planctomycetota bacterium]